MGLGGSGQAYNNPTETRLLINVLLQVWFNQVRTRP